MSKLECNQVEPRLQDFVDGLLEPGEERQLREHLALCAGCRREERQLRRLFIRVAELPREIAPPRDLWPEVAARLGEPGGERPERPRRAERREHAASVVRWTASRWAMQAAAAVVFMVLGALLVQLSGVAVPAGGASRATADAPEGLRLVSSDASGELRTIEADYLRAKEALWLLAYSRHDELSPVKLEIVRRNLLIIDGAIRDLREALAEDPGNRQLETLLLAQHRRSIDLLQRLTRTSRHDRTLPEGA